MRRRAKSHADPTKTVPFRASPGCFLAFITNRSFIDSRTFDGFRSTVATEFSEIRILDLGGDVHNNPKLNGGTHNVFGIQTGVAISFMVRRGKQKGCRIFYARRPEMETAEEKLSFLSSTALRDVSFEEVRPDARHNWINQTRNDFDSLLPVAAKGTKAATRALEERAVFKMFSLGVATNRDEWVYDHSRGALFRKVSFFVKTYEAERLRWERSQPSLRTGDFVSRAIKWTSELEAHLERGRALHVSRARLRQAMYRPFCRRWTYYEDTITALTALRAVEGILRWRRRGRTVNGCAAEVPLQQHRIEARRGQGAAIRRRIEQHPGELPYFRRRLWSRLATPGQPHLGANQLTLAIAVWINQSQ